MNDREVVVVTGASAGVGRATAVAFARCGAKIGLIARGMKGLESAKSEVERAGGEAVIAAADMAQADQAEAAAEKIEQTFGPIDIWINCAMTTVFGEFMTITADEYRRVTDVTYHGYVNGTRAALKRMLPRNKGTVVQVGSALAYRSIPLQTAYCGAKHAIKGFTDSLRSELFHQGSRVWLTMVQLPAVNTPQFDWCKNRMPCKSKPVPPIYQPETIAGGIRWAAHQRRRELILGLNAWVVVWGNKLFPGLGDWYLAKTGYSSQQYDGSPDSQRPDNLWDPVDSDPGARGSFSESAKSGSLQMQWVKLPGYPWYGGIGLFFLLVSALRSGCGKKRN